MKTRKKVYMIPELEGARVFTNKGAAKNCIHAHARWEYDPAEIVEYELVPTGHREMFPEREAAFPKEEDNA